MSNAVRVFLACVTLAAPVASSALAILPNPLVIDHPGGAQGTLELIDVVTGAPAGSGSFQIGIVSPTSTTLVFRVTGATGSPEPGAGLRLVVRDDFGVAVPFAAMGVIEGPDANFAILGTSPVPPVEADFITGDPIAGSVFDPIFLAFDLPLVTDGGWTLGATWDVGPGGGSAQIVPEPASGLLLALGLGTLAPRRPRVAAPLR
jgi:hypothetical protein